MNSPRERQDTEPHMNARETAFLSLMKYENSGVYSNIELSYAIARNGLSGAERGLYTIGGSCTRLSTSSPR